MTPRLVALPLLASLFACASPEEASPTPAGASAANGVKTIVFERHIDAPVERVWKIMFSDAGYRQWTEPFMAGSYFEGSWAQGERIHFLAPGGSGMVAEIAVNRQHELVSIKHIGFVMSGVEDTESDAVRAWAPAYEKYRFAATQRGTRVTIEQDALPGSEDFMRTIWPKALDRLASLSEGE